MKFIRLYEDIFGMNEGIDWDDFDYEEENDNYQFYTHDRVKNNLMKSFYYAKQLKNNQLSMYTNFIFNNKSNNKIVLRPLTNDEFEYMKDNNRSINILDENSAKKLPYDEFMVHIENNSINENFEWSEEDFDYEEENNTNIEIGDMVTISDLYNKYPYWSVSNQYRKAVDNMTPLRVFSIGNPSYSDENKGIKKIVHFNGTDIFYVPIEVCIKI